MLTPALRKRKNLPFNPIIRTLLLYCTVRANTQNRHNRNFIIHLCKCEDTSSWKALRISGKALLDHKIIEGVMIPLVRLRHVLGLLICSGSKCLSFFCPFLGLSESLLLLDRTISSTSASYSKDSGFETWPRDWLYWRFSFLDRCWESILK
jgi:hypothetical protein